AVVVESFGLDALEVIGLQETSLVSKQSIPSSLFEVRGWIGMIVVCSSCESSKAYTVFAKKNNTQLQIRIKMIMFNMVHCLIYHFKGNTFSNNLVYYTMSYN
ncbi:unnamed protein product, partial [Owenia fusiformis]